MPEEQGRCNEGDDEQDPRAASVPFPHRVKGQQDQQEDDCVHTLRVEWCYEGSLGNLFFVHAETVCCSRNIETPPLMMTNVWFLSNLY